jgi:hypothetical protein
MNCLIRRRTGRGAGRPRPSVRDVGLDDQYEIASWGESSLDGDVNAERWRPLPAVRPPDTVRPGWWAGFG